MSPAWPMRGTRSERAGTEDLEAEPAELGLTFALERGEAHTGRPDSECERLPPVPERGVPHGDRQRGLVHVMQAGRRKQLGEMTSCPPARPDSPASSGSSSCTASQNGARGVCPPAWSHTHAATTPPSRDTRHLGQSAHRIVHEVNDELRQDSAEVTIGKTAAPRRLRRVRQLRSAPGRRRHPLRRIDRCYGCRSETSDELGRQRARATAPTSSARSPGTTWARSANDGASRTEYRPMKRS